MYGTGTLSFSSSPTNFTTKASLQQIYSNIQGESYADLSGTSIAISDDGTTLIVGAQENDAGGRASGHARIWRDNGSTWTYLGEINGDSTQDRLGFSQLPYQMMEISSQLEHLVMIIMVIKVDL